MYLPPCRASWLNILVEPGSNLGQDTEYPEVVHRFPQSFLVHTGTIPQSEAQKLLSHIPFSSLFTNHPAILRY
jgi:hypothetical protein